MDTFRSVDDKSLAGIIDAARNKVVYVSPGVGSATAHALIRAIAQRKVVTIIIDSDEDAYRIGYGDHQGLEVLHNAAKSRDFPLRRQAGVRIGILVADDDLTIWAPTALSVEQERDHEQPNGICLKGSAVATIEAAVGSDESDVLSAQVEIGREKLPPDELNKTVESLKADPPAPFNLAQKTRVFSTRFQFVEAESRGAEWTAKKIKLSSLILNADLPEALQDILDTRFQPFKRFADIAFPVPALVDGEPAYREDRTRIEVQAKQTDIEKQWENICDRYLKQVKGFGWLIERKQLASFNAAAKAYEECLQSWVKAFQKHIETKEEDLIDSLANSISGRLTGSKKKNIDVRAEVRNGWQRMRVIEPKVRVVLKNVSWESSRDQEFNEALRQAFSDEELKGWFEEYTAAREQETLAFDDRP